MARVCPNSGRGASVTLSNSCNAACDTPLGKLATGQPFVGQGTSARWGGRATSGEAAPIGVGLLASAGRGAASPTTSAVPAASAAPKADTMTIRQVVQVA